MRDYFRLGYSVRMSAGEETAEALLYGEIISNMPEEWKWDREDKSARDFDEELKKAKASGARRLLLRINSPGGLVNQSIAMRAILARAGFEEVVIRIEGLCASAACNIATLPGARVEMVEGAEYMIHNPWSLAIGEAKDLRREAEHLEHIQEVARDFYRKRTGQSEEQIREWMDAETWFTARDAVKYGFADQVLEAEAGAGQAAACADPRTLAVMRGMYRNVPAMLAETGEPERVEPGTGEFEEDGPGTEAPSPEHIDGSEIETEEVDGMDGMENQEQEIREEPAAEVLDEIQVRQAAVAEERQRVRDIDAVTLPGYERMAAEAKENGDSVQEFMAKMVAAQRAKGGQFMDARRRELEPAKDVRGASPEEEKDEANEMKAFAKEIGRYAAAMKNERSDMY